MEDPQEGFDLDWREACALLGCSQSHFYNLVNAGGIPAPPPGRRLCGVPEVPVASGRPGDNLNPTILFQPLDDLFARHPVPPCFRCVLNTHLGRICQAFDVYFVCI